jgi:lysophospholipase L1-like esterase
MQNAARHDNPPARQVRTLVVLGDSTCVGIGDQLPDGGWRGFGPLLGDVLGEPGEVTVTNLSFTGARLGTVRGRQLPAALALRPDAVVIIAGMNDTMRSDFNPGQLLADLDEVIGSLIASGAVVVTVRFHDHAKIFPAPGPLRRALTRRIDALNSIVDAVLARHPVGHVDLHTLPGTYDKATWSVDRLHPSERGHRMLAGAFAGQLEAAGCHVPGVVGLECSGGAGASTAKHVLWLVLKGIPWLWRRGADLVPYAAAVLLRAVLRGEPTQGTVTAVGFDRHNP